MLKKMTLLDARHATEDEIVRVHDRDYVARIKEMSDANGGDAGELTPFGPGSYEIAQLSAGGVIVAVDAVMDGTVRRAYVLNRPPGHHAEAGLGRGFCIFGNIPVAVRHLQEVHGLSRVAVVDWDVHHGNGTQSMFIDDPSVLAISVHQDNFFPPMSGAIDERGTGAGHGATLNVPLPPGAGHAAYIETFEKVVQPALRQFQPEFIMVASGFDGSAIDPLGRMMAYSETYRNMARMLADAAEELCDGRLVAAHEGGYSTAYVPFAGVAAIEGLSGMESGVEDPFLPIFQGMGGQDLQPHQASLIAQAAGLVADIPTA